MVWFRVDDNLTFHQKTLVAGNEAMGMWVRAGAYCSHHLTDGYISNEIIASLGGQRLARKLVAAALWVQSDTGYQFHDWAERNPLKVVVEAERKAAAERKERWRAKRQSASIDAEGTRSGTQDTTQDERIPDGDGTAGGTPTPTRAATQPSPAQPSPIEEPLPRKRGERLPGEWMPSQAEVDWQRENGITDALARRELPKFRDYWAAQSGQRGVKADWPATWRNWLRTAQERESPTPNAARIIARAHDPLGSAR